MGKKAVHRRREIKRFLREELKKVDHKTKNQVPGYSFHNIKDKYA